MEGAGRMVSLFGNCFKTPARISGEFSHRGHRLEFRTCRLGRTETRVRRATRTLSASFEVASISKTDVGFLDSEDSEPEALARKAARRSMRIAPGSCFHTGGRQPHIVARLSSLALRAQNLAWFQAKAQLQNLRSGLVKAAFLAVRGTSPITLSPRRGSGTARLARRRRRCRAWCGRCWRGLRR